MAGLPQRPAADHLHRPYGKLRLWGAGVGKGTQVDILTPQSLDQGAWVLATSTNVIEEGPRERSATPSPPTPFPGIP